ncbi:MAG TPA: von Willebrand factor type A domain-containing protein [Chitinophagaceae bacterium]|nr:von Willebrand factor type A domain-containing protein [Chitinophagaceae bacterium]
MLLASPAGAQFYLRGEVRDDKGQPLSNAKLLLHSNKLIYYSGDAGSFGIAVAQEADSMTVSMEGYFSLVVAVKASAFQRITLQSIQGATKSPRNNLASFTKDFTHQEGQRWTVAAETYSALVENEFIEARRFPETGFAIRTDRASYSNIRRFLNMDTRVPPDAVRIEELMNYFNFNYQPPPKDSMFNYRSVLSDCPWNPENMLLFLHICSRKIDPEKIPPSNLVFLIDISGSMDMPNRLPLLKSAFKLLVDNLRTRDTVSIVVYGSSVGVWLPPTAGNEKEKIRKSIEQLYPGGSTPGASGILTAYRLARSQFIKGGNNRVILATDGDFNVGASNEDELEELISKEKQYGIYLSCLGVGMGNYKDSKLEILAKKGNGNFAYLDNEEEAEKVMVKEFTQTLYSVADNAYLNVRLNPDLVKEYRLIGYDNKLRALADSLSEVEGGDIGSGHSMLALMEIKPVPGLRQGKLASVAEGLANVCIHYQLPGDSMVLQSSYRCPPRYQVFSAIPRDYQFASAVAMFAFLIKESDYAKGFNWNDVLIMADQSMNPEDAVQQEFVDMVEKARKIYGRSRRHRKLIW